jgi:hypothetical protein
MNFHFGEASKILLKTTPYLFIRTAIYGVLGIAIALYLGFVLLIGKVFGGGGVIFFIIGLAVLVGLLRMAQRYALYLVDAGHIAVITELITNGSLPDGINQFQYGKELVTRMFKEVSLLFVVDRLVDGIIRVMNRTVIQVTEFLPLPGMEGVTKIANSIIDFSLTYVDETILSYNLARGDENIWESAKRGIILYAQNWKPILITGVACAATNFLAFIVVFLVLLIPFGMFSMMTANQTLKLFWFGVALSLAYGIKLALFKPFFQTSMILTFNEAIAGQVPNLEWEQRLDMASDKFRELKEKAANYVSSRTAPGQAAPEPGQETVS